MANNKVVLTDGTVLIDLTGDTAAANHVLKGYTFHDRTGAAVTGTNAFDVDSSGATATTGEILAGKTAAVQGTVITGDMPNNGAVTGTIDTKAGQYVVPQGYHDGSGKVSIDTTEQAKIIPSNIKTGINILGVTGTYGGEAVSAQAKSATPKLTAQTITPDEGYDYLSQVTIAAIPIAYADNASGGKTVTIG